MKWSQNHGIYCHNSFGSIFGGGIRVGGHDLLINNNLNIITSNFLDLGHWSIYAYGSTEAKSYLTGSYEFQVSEIEVYTIW